MRKSGPTYKMSKSHKMLLANILDPHKRNAFKRSLIDAELFAAETAKHVDKRKKGDKVESDD